MKVLDRSYRRRLIGAAACVVAVAGAGNAQAATATTNFNVTLTLTAECKLTSATDLAFGSSGVIQATIATTSAIGVQCTNTTPYNVGLGTGNGTGATTTARKMTSGAGATVNYAMWRDSAHTQNWGNTVSTDTVAGTGNGAIQTLTVYGTVPAQTTPAAGSYSDIVQVTVTY